MEKEKVLRTLAVLNAGDEVKIVLKSKEEGKELKFNESRFAFFVGAIEVKEEILGFFVDDYGNIGLLGTLEELRENIISVEKTGRKKSQLTIFTDLSVDEAMDTGLCYNGNYFLCLNYDSIDNVNNIKENKEEFIEDCNAMNNSTKRQRRKKKEAGSDKERNY